MSGQAIQERAEGIRQELRAAEARALQAVKAIFPIGTIVRVWVSRGPISLCVTGYAFGNPLEVLGENVRTGKRRRFYVGYDPIDSVKLPEPARRRA
jgi:hypothetical protein